jgi:secreted trypsin-like serine protease
MRRLVPRLLAFALLAIPALAQAPAASAIIGGTPAAPLTWNWNARLEITTPHRDEVCSGSVVSASVILTAAHCVVDEATNTIDLPSDFVVTTGRTTFDDPASGQVLGVTKVAIYPAFSLSSVRGDVALLQLASPTTSQVVPLAQPSDPRPLLPGAGVVVAGWGLQQADDTSLPPGLQTVQQVVQTDSLCKSALADVTLGYDPATMYCSASSDVSAGTCNGDSGGPAVGLSTANQLVQVGVVSWNREGCVHPDVFARVPALSGWLAPTIAAMQANATPPPVVTPPVVTPVVTPPVVAPPAAVVAPVATVTPTVAVATAKKLRLAIHVKPVTAVAGRAARLRFWAALKGARAVAHLRVLDSGSVLYQRTTPAFAPDGTAQSVAWRVPRSLHGSLRFCVYATSKGVSSAHVCAALRVHPAPAG